MDGNKPFYAPVMRLEIEGMKLQVLRYLQVEHEHLEAAIETAAKKALAEYDLEAEVKRQVNAALQQAIEQYYRFGDGHNAIFAAVTEALSASTHKITEAIRATMEVKP